MKRKSVSAALVKGAAAGTQSNVVSSKSQVVKTVMTSIPPNRYGQRKGR